MEQIFHNYSYFKLKHSLTLALYRCYALVSREMVTHETGLYAVIKKPKKSSNWQWVAMLITFFGGVRH